MIPNYFVCQAARQWVTVALSGIGGDELFAGYERYRGALAADSYQRLPRLLTGGIGAMIHALPQWEFGGLWIDRMKRFVEGAGLPLPERYQRYLAAFTVSEKLELFSVDFMTKLSQSGKAEAELA